MSYLEQFLDGNDGLGEQYLAKVSEDGSKSDGWLEIIMIEGYLAELYIVR